jgi:hypothetical protein
MTAWLLGILEAIRRECLMEEVLTTEAAMDRAIFLRRIEALVRTRARHPVPRIRDREQQRSMTPDYLENLPVFDETDAKEWMGEMNGMLRIRDPARNRRTHTDDFEPLFQNDSLGRILSALRGDVWLERSGDSMCNVAGMTRQTSAVPDAARLINPRKGASAKLSAEDYRLIRERLRDPRVRNQEVPATDILSIPQDSWAGTGHDEQFEEMSAQMVRQLLCRWEWCWRREHRKRRPAVNPEDARAFDGGDGPGLSPQE